jgi:hypothetical protein
MSSTVLSGDFTVYYGSENRQKRIVYSGSGNTYTVNELYSALQDLFDELTQLDDGTPMSAQTPTEYTIGIIDTGDRDPWFIDDHSVEFLTGGAIQTSLWKRTTSSNTGIVRFDYTVGGGTDLVNGDVGLTATSSNGDTGTLLWFTSDGSNGTAWVRPTNNTATHDWDGTPTFEMTTGGGTGTGLTMDAASTTGEALWANVFSLGTIEDNTHLYIEQNGSLLIESDDRLTAGASDWWSDGHIDITVKVKSEDTEIDEGVIVVFARQATKSYSYFETDLSSGGRNPIPLQTGDDLSNTPGTRQMILTTASGDFTVGEVIEDDSDPTIQGIVTSNSGTAPDITLQYYLIGDPLTDFGAGTGGFTGADSTTTATAVAPSDVNAATYTDINITHGSNETFDIDEDDTTENYSIVIDCNSRPLSQVYQYAQFVTQRGETDTTETDGLAGHFYRGSDYRLNYNALTGSIAEGAVVTQLTSGATGTVVSHNLTDDIIILRNSRGTFDTTNNVEVDGSNYVTMTTGTATAITPIASAPFGTFLGGVFFCAPGVVLTNVPAADATNFQLVNDGTDGGAPTVVNPPNKVTLAVTNLRSTDRVAVYRLASGTIEKTEYSGTAMSSGATSIVASSAIRVDTPGKSTGGTVVVVDNSADAEYIMRYSSWTAATFTLASSTGNLTASASSSALGSTAGLNLQTVAKVGDIVYFSTQGEYSYIVSIPSSSKATIFPFVSAQSAGNDYTINALPVAAVSTDNVYVPLLYRYEATGTDGTPGSESAVLTYNSTDIDTRIVVRNASTGSTSATIPMIPYTADVTLGSGGLSNAAIRSLDSIKS